jgi:hypothetical protein
MSISAVGKIGCIGSTQLKKDIFAVNSFIAGDPEPLAKSTIPKGSPRSRKLI